MGFLDDLKIQASAARARQIGSDQAEWRTTQLVEAAARDCRRYLMDLASNLDVLRPAPRIRYVLDKQVTVEAVPRGKFRFDARSKTVGSQDVIDYIVMTAMVESGRPIVVAKNFLNEIELLEKRLVQSGTEFHGEAVRRPEDNKLLEMRYTFVADVRLSTTVTCRHSDGTLHFRMRNLDALETVDCEFAPHQITQARLDELARWWVGQPHSFLDGAARLRRSEAR